MWHITIVGQKTLRKKKHIKIKCLYEFFRVEKMTCIWNAWIDVCKMCDDEWWMCSWLIKRNPLKKNTITPTINLDQRNYQNGKLISKCTKVINWIDPFFLDSKSQNYKAKQNRTKNMNQNQKICTIYKIHTVWRYQKAYDIINWKKCLCYISDVDKVFVIMR